MSNYLRNPWVSAVVCTELASALEKRDRGSFQGSEAFSTIGPLGELQLPGCKSKPLQVLQFISYEDPYTAILSDKSVFITCKFSSEARLKYEDSNRRLSALKGGIIKVNSYKICFFGVDGVLFWKGGTYQAQVEGETTSRKTDKGAKNSTQNDNIGSSKSVSKDFDTGNTDINFKALHIPEPVLFITDFTLIGSEGSSTFGRPVVISSRTDIRELLSDLPRKEYSEDEISVSLKQAGRPSAGASTASHQENKGKGDKYQKGNRPSQGNSSRKDVSSRPPKSPKNMYSSDDEIRSQPDIGDDGDISSQEDSQLPFATQAPPSFSTTFDDLDFSTKAGPKSEAHAKSPPSSPLKSPSGSVGHLPQVVIRKSLEKKKDPRPHQARKNAEQTKSLSTKPRFINYADGSDSEGTAASSVKTGRLKGISEGTANRNKRKRDRLDDPSIPGSGSVNLRNGKRLPIHEGWQGMRGITKEETIIPKDQQEILDRPESWYPYQNMHHVSGYDAISKAQLVPKSHPPRERTPPPHVQVVVPAVTTPKLPSSPSSSSLTWSSSPERSPVRDVNAMPPHSSMPPASPSQRAGRWSGQANGQGNPESTDGSIYQPDQASMQREVKERESKNSRIQSSPPSDLGDKLNDTSKRVTRAANGISKKAPVDPNNVEPSRMAKAGQKPRLPIARKRRRSESEPEEVSNEDYESSEDEDIHELINDPGLPVGVVNPDGRTRVDIFGSILKAQQVALWEKQKKRAQEPRGGTDGGTEDDDSGAQSGDDASDKPPETGGGGVGNSGFRAAVQKMMGSTSLSSSGVNQTQESPLEIKGVGNHSHSEGVPELGNGPTDFVEEGPTPSVVQPANNSEMVESLLPSEPNKTSPPELERDKAPEPVPESSVELPMAEPMDVDDPQAIINSETVVSKDQQAKTLGDSLSTAILLQTSSAPEVLNLSGSQESRNIITPSLPSSASIAPTVQVEETPYRKGLKVVCGGDSSPTASRLRTGPGYLEDGSDDITRIPGTNTEELHNSIVPTSPRIVQSSTTSRGSPSESQMVSLNHVSSPLESENHTVDLPDDFVMSQQQLQREFLEHEHMEVEVPATSEVEETRIEDDIRSKPPPVFKLPKSAPEKARKVLKAIDFESQEISAAANANRVSSMLEEQKREFMGSERAYEFEDLFQGSTSSLENESLSQELGVGVSKGNSSPEVINIQSSPSVSRHLSVESDEDMDSDFSQLNTRKRPQSPPLEISIPTKKPRTNSESPDKTSSRLASVPPPCVAMYEKVKTPTKPPGEPSPKSTIKEPLEEEDLELSDDDPMAGFLDIGSPGEDDDFEPSWPPQTSSEPEMYSGIRKRHLHVPGYEKLTDDQKKELDTRRQEYFGVKTSSERLFSVELQRSMQKASSSSDKAKSKEIGERVKRKEDEWYRDEDTPMKVFFRKFKELKQVKAELAIREREGGVSSDNA